MKIPVFTLLMLWTLSLFAQPKLKDYEIQLGPYFKAPKRAVPTAFVGNDARGFYMVYSGGKTGAGADSFVRFGYDLNIKGSVKLDWYTKGYEIDSKACFMHRGAIYSIGVMRAWDYESGADSRFRGRAIVLQRVDATAMTLTEPTLLEPISNEVGEAISLSVRFAADSSHIALIYNVPTANRDFQQIGVVMLDEMLNKTWGDKVVIPHMDKLFRTSSYNIDDQGNLYVLGKRYFNKRKNKSWGKVNYDYQLFKFDALGQMDSTNIQSQGKYLSDMHVMINEGGDIISAGFYSEQNTGLSGGVFYLRMDGDTKEVLHESFKEFDMSFLTQNMTERQAKKLSEKIDKGKEVELPFFHIDEFIIDSDGGIKMIAESRYIYTIYIYTQYGSYPQTHFDYDDIMIVNISAEGEIAWAQRVAKNQHTVQDGAIYSSYATALHNDNLYFFYNDNPNNLQYTGTGRVAPMTKNSSTLVLASKVDAEGTLKRTGLFTKGEVDIKVRPSLCYQVSADEMLLFGHRGLKNQRFILLRFKD